MICCCHSCYLLKRKYQCSLMIPMVVFCVYVVYCTQGCFFFTFSPICTITMGWSWVAFERKMCGPNFLALPSLTRLTNFNEFGMKRYYWESMCNFVGMFILTYIYVDDPSFQISLGNILYSHFFTTRSIRLICTGL